MSEPVAWILDFGGSVRVAIGELELIHLETQPKLFSVPKTPNYCQNVVIWQDTIVPAIDLGIALKGQVNAHETCYAAIVRYRTVANGPLAYAALLLAEIPVRMIINDSLACPLPNELIALKALAVSCFSLNGESIPIIELASVFSQASQNTLGTENE